MSSEDSKDKTSIDCLHTTESRENIRFPNDSAPVKESHNETLTGDNKLQLGMSEIQTVFEKLDLKDKKILNSAHSDITTTQNRKIVDTLEIKDSSSTSNIATEQSSNLNTQQSSSIYSVNSNPSGRIIRRRETTTNVFPVGCMGCKDEDTTTSPRRFLDANEASNDRVGHILDTPRKRPSSAKNDARNPLTGEGVQKPDNRKQSYKPKDGNPLLGLGYEEPTVSTANKPRVPPGGYSQGLW